MIETTPMMAQYRRIKDEFADSIVFFRLGDFYEMFDADAREASSLLDLTLTQRAGSPMCGIPYHAATSYISRLLAAGRKVAICEQVSPPCTSCARRWARAGSCDLPPRTRSPSEFPSLEVGAVPPFGPTVPAVEVIDHELLRHERILFPAGDHQHSVLVDPREVVRVTAAKTASICQD